jgi:hypothetical protein
MHIHDVSYVRKSSDELSTCPPDAMAQRGCTRIKLATEEASTAQARTRRDRTGEFSLLGRGEKGATREEAQAHQPAPGSKVSSKESREVQDGF